jgi:diguanylate cyclase (GGDEF)-like protein
MARMPKHHFHWFRFHERAGTRHSVENAYRQQRRVLDPESVLSADDSLRARERSIWFSTAAFFISCGLIPLFALALPSFPGFEIPDDMITTWQLGAGASAILVGCGLVAFGLRDVPTLPWMPAALALGIALISVAVLTIPQYGLELIGMYSLPLIASAFYLDGRLTVAYSLVVAAIFGYLGWYERAEPFSYVTSGMMMFFLVGSSVIMALARSRIQQGIEINVEIAGRDPLTGAANLRRLRTRLDDEIRRARRRELPVTLIVLDLDDFGEVNRRFSHSLGDATLVACARAMQKVIRRDELLARRGDDEFAVVAVGESSDELHALIERLQRAVMIERQRLCPDVTNTVSVGYATWRDGESGSALMRRADSALHIKRMVGPEDL